VPARHISKPVYHFPGKALLVPEQFFFQFWHIIFYSGEEFILNLKKASFKWEACGYDKDAIISGI
jgi:hypothetical protein